MGRGGSKSLWPPSITGVLMMFSSADMLSLNTVSFSFNKLEEVKILSVLIAALEHLVLNSDSSFKVIGSSLTSN